MLAAPARACNALHAPGPRERRQGEGLSLHHNQGTQVSRRLPPLRQGKKHVSCSSSRLLSSPALAAIGMLVAACGNIPRRAAQSDAAALVLRASSTTTRRARARTTAWATGAEKGAVKPRRCAAPCRRGSCTPCCRPPPGRTRRPQPGQQVGLPAARPPLGSPLLLLGQTHSCRAAQHEG